MLKVRVNRKDKKTEYVRVYSPEEITFEHTLKFVRGKRNIQYIEHEAYFDSETSKIDGKQWIYQWALLIGNLTIMGRSAREFINILHKFKETYELDDTRRLLIYVHNLSYDWHNLESFLLSEFETEDYLFTGTRSPLYTLYDGIEFRCSYRLTGYSLDRLSNTYAVKYAKATGTIDYSLVRYPDTPLSDTENSYMISDVHSQRDGVHEFVKSKGYPDIFFSELTKTGFVRADARKASRHAKGWHNEFVNSRLSVYEYQMCKKAFMGGYTHGNRYWADELITADIGHRDFSSRYPASQMLDYFPVGSSMHYGTPDNMEELQSLCDTYCCLFELTITNVNVDKKVTMPYLSYSKCEGITHGSIVDNGRILQTDDIIKVTFCELDFDIFKRQYTFNVVKYGNVICWKRGELPKWLKGVIMQYYKGKTELKDIGGREFDYLQSKEGLNSIYGMSATDPIRTDINRGSDGIFEEKENKPSDIADKLDKFYNSRNSFLPYQWSVWTTAHARHHLFTAMDIIGYENVLYCDTDSIFYFKDGKVEKSIIEYNKQLIEHAEKEKAYAVDSKGQKRYLGSFEDENDHIKQMKYLHSKCYGIVDEKNEMKITIAGVPSNFDGYYKQVKLTISREEELGELDNLTDGFIFNKCGGTRMEYITTPLHTELIDGHKVEFGNMAILHQVTKEMSSLPKVDETTGLPIFEKLSK